MEQRVKERLTGAALLVGVVVLLVPELFRGDRTSANATRPADPTAPPVQSYMIELGTAPPAVPDGETLPAVVPQSVATAATVAPAAPSAAMPVVVSKPAPLQPAAVPPVAAEKSSAPVTVIATPPKSRVAAPKVVSHGWAVQVGSFGKRENAARMVQQAAKKGVKLAIAGPDDRGLYRVRSSIQATRAVAAQLQGELQSKGFKGIVARVP